MDDYQQFEMSSCDNGGGSRHNRGRSGNGCLEFIVVLVIFFGILWFITLFFE